MKNKDKEFLYIGHYLEGGHYILKIGTTNNLKRRQKEHTKNYGHEFIYDWHIALSKYNTLRYEDINRNRIQKMGIGFYTRNDRFLCLEKPESISIKIRKEYTVTLK